MTDIYQARAKIESLCIEMAFQKGDDHWEANALAASHRLNKYSESEHIDMEEWQNRHSAFHQSLVAGCMSPRLLQIRHSLYEKSTRYRNLWLKENISNTKNLDINQKEHSDLLDLALNRDTESAARLIEKHILTPVEIIKKSLSQL